MILKGALRPVCGLQVRKENCAALELQLNEDDLKELDRALPPLHSKFPWEVKNRARLGGEDKGWEMLVAHTGSDPLISALRAQIFCFALNWTN